MRHFYLKQKVFSLTDRYKVFDENQNILFYVKSKMFSIHNKMKFMDQTSDTVLYHFKRKLFRIMPIYEMLDANFIVIATVRRKFAFFKPVVLVDKEDMNFNIEGNYFAHSFQIFNDSNEVASVTKKWLSWGDSYQVSVHDDRNEAFYLALVILIDRMFHERKNHSSISI